MQSCQQTNYIPVATSYFLFFIFLFCLDQAQDEVMTQNRDVVSRLEHKVQNLEKQWTETRQNSGRNAAELSGLRQQTHSQLQTLVSSGSRYVCICI